MRAARTQRGIALVTAVMIVAIAAAIAVQIAFAHQVWFRQMENVADRDATDWLRRGALHWASLALLEDAAQNSTDHLGEPWAIGLPILPVDGGTIKVSIEDAQSRFNLNSVGDPANLQVLKKLLGELRLDPLLADSLADWIDPDSDTRPGGAEDVYYLNLDPPYRAANQPLASIDELRLIRGCDAKTVAALVQGLDLPVAQRIVDGRLGKPFKDINDFKSKLPQGPTQPAAGIGVKTDYFLVSLDTSIGRHERHSEALLKRDAGAKTTTVIWHRPQPLIGGGPQASEGSDEPDDSQ